jgi:hypothetical protein
MKRLLILSAVAYGVWTLVKAARQRQAATTTTDVPPVTPS